MGGLTAINVLLASDDSIFIWLRGKHLHILMRNRCRQVDGIRPKALRWLLSVRVLLKCLEALSVRFLLYVLLTFLHDHLRLGQILHIFLVHLLGL